MSGILHLFSSQLELGSAFPNGVPEGLRVGVCGVGLVDAAIGTVRLVAEHDPDAVVFIGTCGRHRESGISVGDVVFASTVRLGSGDVAQGRMRIPSLLPSEVACDMELGLRIASKVPVSGGREVLPARVSCTLGVTESDELAAELEAHDRSQVENLEAFSVVRAAQPLPVAVILGVTNTVGSGGGREWRENFVEMMRLLARGIVATPTETNA